jgi:hypothetical protein
VDDELATNVDVNVADDVVVDDVAAVWVVTWQ